MEATCWEDKQYQEEQSELLEFGLVEIDLESYFITKQFSKLIIPRRTNISAYCTKLTGITQELVAGQGVKLEDAITEISQLVPSSGVVWGGWGHDRDFWVKACKDANVQDPLAQAEYFNLQLLYSFLRGRTEATSLHKALAEEGLEFVNGTQHRALPDAYNTARVILSLLSRIRFFGN